jgi:hypothetical protein
VTRKCIERIFLGFAVLMAVCFVLLGPLRVSVTVHCAVDRVRHGTKRELDDAVLALPSAWCQAGSYTQEKDHESMILLRIPRSRHSKSVAAVVISGHDVFHRRALEFQQHPELLTSMRWETEQNERWVTTGVSPTTFGGAPGYEISHRCAEGCDRELVSSDFVLFEPEVTLFCEPMSPEDLADCRQLLSHVTTAGGGLAPAARSH